MSCTTIYSEVINYISIQQCNCKGMRVTKEGIHIRKEGRSDGSEGEDNRY